MKLYWKIFLISLAFMMLAVGGTSFAFLRYSFENSLTYAERSSVNYNNEIYNAVIVNAEYRRFRNDSLLIGEEELKQSVKYVCRNGVPYSNKTIDGVKITVSGTDYEYSDGHNVDITDQFYDDMENGKCCTRIFEKSGKVYIEAYSLMSVGENSIKIFSSSDISAVYVEYEHEFRFSVLISVAVSVIVAAILFFVTFVILRPLTKVNEALDRIAGGEYETRVGERGGWELRSISENVNTMAQAVEENVKRLESIAEGRKQYVDRLAHEMKTPLTSILCFGDLLRIKKEVPESERVEYAGIIVDEAKRMKNMSSKLLELAVAESAEIELLPLSVMEILKESVTAMSPGFDAGEISLEIREDAEDGAILCDKELFKSLIYNICDNARKASEPGQTVTLTCRRKNGEMQIFVIDRGIGMTKDVLKKVTKPFYMADKDRSRKAGGAGIGLSLCVEIAKLHGATLRAKSRPGKGTTMIISVPEAKETADEK